MLQGFNRNKVSRGLNPVPDSWRPRLMAALEVSDVLGVRSVKAHKVARGGRKETPRTGPRMYSWVGARIRPLMEW